jgi:hypothetical protein
MKKSILSISLTAVFVTAILFSCKKDKTNSFTATDVTGTSVVSGNVNKNVIIPNGSGNWTNSGRINVAGVKVSITVNKGGFNGLYPNSTASGADVYTGTTDANGNYSITVRTNANGVSALITVDGFSGTQDTIINGVTKTGLYATYFGTNTSLTLFMGQNEKFDHNFFGSNVSSNPNTIVIGTAIVTGSVSMNLVRKVTTGTVVSLSTTNIAVPANVPVYLSFDKDPTQLATKVYQTTTSATGTYTFVINTVPSTSSSGFNQDATIWVGDYANSRDTMNFNGTTFLNILPGKQGVYNKTTTNQFGVYTSDIRNATNLDYNSFTQN